MTLENSTQDLVRVSLQVRHEGFCGDESYHMKLGVDIVALLA